MTIDNTETSNSTIETARQAIDDLPVSESVSAGLTAARSMAMAKARELEAQQLETARPASTKVISFPKHYSKFLWPSAAAACASIIALSLALQPQNTEFPAELFEASLAEEAANGQGAGLEILEETELLSVAELDETEWELIQNLDFALWLSEQSQDSLADPQS